MRLDELEGAIIGGRFRLKTMLGKGGYGAVFEAEQLSVGRRCAVKIMLPGRSDDESVEERFRVEARATSRLTHPNSLVLYDFGVDEETGFLFLATEYLDGVTLYEVLEVERILEVERTLSILEQMAGSLADAHRHGLVHRDIKPKNVMLIRRAGQEDFVKVIDFGIAKALYGDLANDDGLTQTGMLIGTPQYMAPEQLLGTGMDERIDQYAMAVLGYKMLTGRNPFQAASPMETAMRHVSERPLPLRTYRPELEVSAEFEDVFLKALEKTPERRYQNVTAFVQALREAGGRSGAQSAVPAPVRKAPLKPTVRIDLNTRDDGGGEPGCDEEREWEGDVALAEPALSTSKKIAPTRVLTPVTSDSLELPAVMASPSVESELFQADEEVAAGGSDAQAEVEREVAVEGRGVEVTTGTMALPQVSTREGISPVVLGVAGLSVLFVLGAVGSWIVLGEGKEGVDEATWVKAGAEVKELKESLLRAEGAAEADERPVQEEEVSLDLGPTMAEAFGAVGLAVSGGKEEALRVEEERQRRLARRPGRVTVTLIPWGTLFIDGKERSNETRQQVRLSPGSYEFSLRQGGEERARRVVDVEAGGNKMVVLEAELAR